MKNSILFILVTISFLVLSCRYQSNETTTSSSDIPPVNQESLAKGFQILENNCFSCHSPNPALEKIVAPTMVAIKQAYIKSGKTEEQFNSDLLNFLNDPSVENSLMPEAIVRFNLMPKMNLNEGQIKDIASYIYNTDLEKPDWFAKQYQNEKLKYKSTTILSPIEMGQSIALRTKGVLGKNLLNAINSKGTENALLFCSTKAIPLTDSMSIALDTRIKRVSDNNRNPDNAANEDELLYIKQIKDLISKGEKPMPKLISIDERHIAYYPIMTNNMCMQCHGQTETDISSGTLSKINKLYPNDKAINYKVNELRGIWVISMNKR